MKKIQGFALIMVLLSFAACSQKNKINQDGSSNDTLAVRKLLVQEIRKNLENQSDVDSINEYSNGMQWVVSYRIDKVLWNSQSISMIFGDINGDSLNDAIAIVQSDFGGNRPEFRHQYVERTTDGYKVKSDLPLFGYRYIDVGNIKNGLIELTGKAFTDSDPMCCPSIIEDFKAKLVGETFVKISENLGTAVDPNTSEFEKAKQEADNLKQKFELEKHNLLKLSFTQESQTEENKTSSTFYFDSSFFIKYFVGISKHAGGGGEIYKFYNPEGLTLRYSNLSDASGSSIAIWFNQHQYEEIIDASGDKKYKDDIVNNNGEEFGEWKQYTNNRPKQEFTYDSDSACYRLLSKDPPDWEQELRLDSLMFVHLFGDK